MIAGCDAFPRGVCARLPSTLERVVSWDGPRKLLAEDGDKDVDSSIGGVDSGDNGDLAVFFGEEGIRNFEGVKCAANLEPSDWGETLTGGSVEERDVVDGAVGSTGGELGLKR